MSEPLIRAGVALVGALPLSVNHFLGSVLGELLWRLKTPARRATEINLRLCYSRSDTAFRERLTRRSLHETGRAMSEMAYIWTRSRTRLERLIVDGVGHELLQAAEADSRGLIVVTPHLGAWELCGLPLACREPLTCLYSPARRLELDNAFIRWRRNVGGDPVPLDAGGLRIALRRLRNGRTVGLLPDQEPPRRHGVFAPFFGNPANTMTLPGTLASRTGARLLVSYAERLPRSAGWRVHYVEPGAGASDPDPVRAASLLNETLERCIRQTPEQYLWSYPRFRLLPGGNRRVYD